MRRSLPPNQRCAGRKRGSISASSSVSASPSNRVCQPAVTAMCTAGSRPFVSTGDVTATTGSGCRSRSNQKNVCGPSEMKYGVSPIRGNALRPSISTGVVPANSLRSSSTGWTKRDRFAIDEDDLVAVAPDEREHRAVLGMQHLHAAATEDLALAAQCDHPAHPVEQARGAALLRFDVHGLVAVERVHHDGQIETGRVRRREAGVAVACPLHGGTDAVAVAEEDVVAHPDLVAVVEDRRAGHREQQAVQ